AKNRTLYPALIEEWERVLQADGRMVLLTSERSLLEATLRHTSALELTRSLSVLVRGVRATIFVVRRR
ncbi:MAG TPA: hypothetical protein VKX16_07725, partial [Chloroflexota bacterium]|nr:hypothetical protein [Chloroflexota bacterium]